MSDSKSPTGQSPETVRSKMLTKVSTALAEGKFNDAFLWAQTVEELSRDDNGDFRTQVNAAIASVLMAASLKTRKLVFRAGGLYFQLTPDMDVMLRSASLLAEVARKSDRGIALAHALQLEGNARQLLEAAELHPKNSYRVTTAAELDSALTALAEIIEVSANLLDGKGPANTRAEIHAVAAEGVANAKGNLSCLFSRKWSDWTKAAVLLKHVRQLLGDSANLVSSEFDRAEAGLSAEDYKKAAGAMDDLTEQLPRLPLTGRPGPR